MKKVDITLHPNNTKQTIQSFGMSSAWWGKMVGAWDHINEQVMKLFYDKVEGIGLTNIRYNIGAGSIDKDYIKDPTRRSETFEIEPGTYDFTKDQYTLKLIDLARKYGCEEIVFFSISPLERMTFSGMVSGSTNKDNPSNHKKEYYLEYTDYILDVVEHFLNKGYPIKYVSPINEPQWEWGVQSQTQEGCYYTKEEVKELYQLFVKRIKERNISVILAGHDGGEWKTAIEYAREMYSDEEINNHMDTFDCHSYWTSKEDKIKTKEQFDTEYPDKQLVMSEWCEMRGGGLDYGMDSALVLANTVYEDLTILDVVSWQYWTGCEREVYRHKVALMYIRERERKVLPTKKFYAFGNFTKFVRPGSVRITETVSSDLLKLSTFKMNEKIVSVIVNDNDEDIEINIKKYQVESFIVTDSNHDLEEITFHDVIPKRSVCTLILKEE